MGWCYVRVVGLDGQEGEVEGVELGCSCWWGVHIDQIYFTRGPQVPDLEMNDYCYRSV